MSFLNNIDENKVKELMTSTEENITYFDTIVDKVVSAYTDNLDTIMKNIYMDIIQTENPSIDIIQKYFLELSNAIYFMGEKVEKLGVYTAMSKSAYKETYNNIYLDNQVKDGEKKNKTTVAELTAIAESGAIYESTVNDIYDKAYKIVKNKVEAAQLMISTLSKIMSKKMAEMQLSMSIKNDISTRQILNEEV